MKMPACVSSSRKECKSLSNRGPTMLQPTKKPPNFLSPQLKKKKKNVEKVEITSKTYSSQHQTQESVCLYFK